MAGPPKNHCRAHTPEQPIRAAEVIQDYGLALTPSPPSSADGIQDPLDAEAERLLSPCAMGHNGSEVPVRGQGVAGIQAEVPQLHASDVGCKSATSLLQPRKRQL